MTFSKSTMSECLPHFSHRLLQRNLPQQFSPIQTMVLLSAAAFTDTFCEITINQPASYTLLLKYTCQKKRKKKAVHSHFALL